MTAKVGHARHNSGRASGSQQSVLFATIRSCHQACRREGTLVSRSGLGERVPRYLYPGSVALAVTDSRRGTGVRFVRGADAGSMTFTNARNGEETMEESEERPQQQEHVDHRGSLVLMIAFLLMTAILWVGAYLILMERGS